MRRVQAAALDLFAKHGFDAVTVEDVATAAGVGPASVYRYFSTKERIVLWDQYDPPLFDAIRRHLPGSPLDAVQRGIIESLVDVYAQDKRRILRRAELIMRTPSVLAASASDRAEFKRGLAALFFETHAVRDRLAAAVTAGAVSAALEAAVEEWVATKGKHDLARHLTKAFAQLRALAAARKQRN
jgi:AcrR family transcriptional regulator